MTHTVSLTYQCFLCRKLNREHKKLAVLTQNIGWMIVQDSFRQMGLAIYRQNEAAYMWGGEEEEEKEKECFIIELMSEKSGSVS